jgi:hypothetical protein
MPASVSRRASVCCLLALLSLNWATGCSLLAPRPQAELSPDTSYTIEVRARGCKPQETQVAIQGDETVQKAIEHVGANRRFKGLEVALVRVTQLTGKEEILKVPYSRRTRNIDILHDYAVLPGDRVMIVEDNTTVVDEMLDSMPGPLQGLLGSGSKR